MCSPKYGQAEQVGFAADELQIGAAGQVQGQAAPCNSSSRA